MNLKYELRNGWKVINEMNNIDAVMKYSDENTDILVNDPPVNASKKLKKWR